MAVPVRGRLLADNISPTVGTLIETHPRASLLFGLGLAEEDLLPAIREYKRKSGDTREQTETRARPARTLWRYWSEKSDLTHHGAVKHNGSLDSLVCATVAYMFQHEPAALLRLRHEVAGKTGRGPFYVVAPDAGKDDGRNVPSLRPR